LLLAVVTVFAQSDTLTVTKQAGTVTGWLFENWYFLFITVCEVFLRLFPTEKNYSIIGWITKMIDLILPNVKKNMITDSIGEVKQINTKH